MSAPPLRDPQPVKAAEGVLEAFDKYRIVALSEAHQLQEEHDFIQSLFRHPAFPAKANDIVVECGNALYQDILDRYIAGGAVPTAELRQVWQNTTQSPFGPWDSRVYEQLFATVREVNKTLPARKRLRVLAGDPPIDWTKVRNQDEAEIFLSQREPHFASVVERQVLARNRKALVIIGMGHLLKVQPRMAGAVLRRVDGAGGNGGPPPMSAARRPRSNVTALLEEHYPGSTLVIAPHVGFGISAAKPAQLNAEWEPRLRSWPRPSLAAVKDTWLGALEAAAIFPGIIGPDGQLRNPYAGFTVAEMVDAYLYLGPQDALTRSTPAPEAFRDRAYLAELNRRAQMISGRPFDPQRFAGSSKPYNDPNTSGGAAPLRTK